MIEKIGNIWDFHDRDKWIVITTNIGWNKNHIAIMGAGIARAAADIDSGLPVWYGKKCKKYGRDTATLPYHKKKFILFPTKALDEDQPWLSWKQGSSLELIGRSTRQLVVLADILEIKGIALPMVGCANGGLRPKQVLPILRKHLDDRFVLYML